MLVSLLVCVILYSLICKVDLTIFHEAVRDQNAAYIYCYHALSHNELERFFILCAIQFRHQANGSVLLFSA